MKKFNFSMQKVLEYNEHIQNIEKDILKDMRLKYFKLCTLMDELTSKYETYKNEYSSKCRNGIAINEIMNLRNFISDVQIQIKILSNKIKFAENEINNQVQKVVGVTREKTSMEKLKDKHYEVYKAQERKEDEIFINEFISNLDSSRSIS